MPLSRRDGNGALSELGGLAPGVDFDPADSDFTPELRAELLDGEAWAGMLELYARPTKLAVALVDANGQMVGVCQNPQPIWTLARHSQPAANGACPFCLETTPHCSAAADAWQARALVVARDQGGFAHIAVPIILGNRLMGTLFAGQSLDHYPQFLPLQRLARTFNLSAQEVWRLARQQVPISGASLIVYGNLLSAFGQTFLNDRYRAISERKSVAVFRLINEKLSRNVTEKEVLLREVHHRVKNNLQVISSLLNMQSSSLSNETAVAALLDSRLRVLSMALIHEQLYSNDQWDAIDFEEYAKLLVSAIFHSFGGSANLVISRFNTSRVLLDVDQAIPCGLILSELVTNVLKYAYPDGKGGEVVIGLGENVKGTITLSVADNGVGLPADVNANEPTSMGLEIVNLLANQLGGILTVQSGPGTRFTIEFPRESKDKALAFSA